MNFKVLKHSINILAVVAILLFSKCAQVLPLNGGARDTQAPKLLRSVPENASLNFKSKMIEFSFDEFVQVKDIANQLVVTPRTKELPVVEARGKVITVKFNEDLLPNTTYRLFFGNAIVDMHEANGINNFEYVFSTGDRIDSFDLKGQVITAFNLKPASDITIGLFADSVSSFTGNKPVYFTKTDNSGHYQLSYLPANKFKLLAFGDKNKNLMYDAPEEFVAFNDQSINTETDSVVDFELFKEESTKLFVKRAFSPAYGIAHIIYNKDVQSKADAYYKRDDEFINSSGSYNDTCEVYYHSIYDTLRLIVKHEGLKQADTLAISVLSQERFQKQITDKKVFFIAEINQNSSEKVDYFSPLTLRFNNEIDNSAIHPEKIVLMQKLDSGQKQVSLNLGIGKSNKIQIAEKLSPAGEYVLYLKKGAFKSKIGVENDSVRIVFKTTDPEDYASLALKLLLPKKENYIVQILSAEERIIAEQYVELSITSSAEQNVLFKNLPPGNYFVKVIEDKNKNKKWDTGSILMKNQPELIYFNAAPIKLLANWDSETEWIVK